jgi:hypothetical protein
MFSASTEMPSWALSAKIVLRKNLRKTILPLFQKTNMTWFDLPKALVDKNIIPCLFLIRCTTSQRQHCFDHYRQPLEIKR